MTSGAKERELKLAVATEAALERLEASFGGTPSAVHHQHNVYFDAERRLTDARWGLRLRTVGKRSVLTLKGPKESGADLLVSRPETPDVEVSTEVADRLLAGAEDPLVFLGAGLEGTPEYAYVETARAALDGLIPIVWGEMKNERRKYPLEVAKMSLTVEVDRTDYGRFGRRFEVELEIPAGDHEAEARAWVEARFVEVGLPLEAAPAKQARLMAFLDQG